jgi:hypothetical protein
VSGTCVLNALDQIYFLGGIMFQANSAPNTESAALSADVSRLKRIGPRLALVSGFSALLVLMAILAVDSMRALRELEASNSEVRQNYLTRERALRKIRVSLYESGELLREYTLKDSSSQIRPSYIAQLRDIREHASAAMETCLRQSPPNLEDHLRKLASELESYWLAANETLSQGTQKKSQARRHRAALDQRAAVLAIASEVGRVNELELRQAELEVSTLFAKSRQRVLNLSAAATGIGLVLALATIAYVSRLENRARESYLESLRYHDEFKELSTQLVDAQEDGQRVISREVHDDITQNLGALLIHVQDLLDDPQGFGSGRTGLQKIRVLAVDANCKLRGTAALLKPSILLRSVANSSGDLHLSER